MSPSQDFLGDCSEESEASGLPLLPDNDAVEDVQASGLPKEVVATATSLADRDLPQRALRAVASYLLQGPRLQSMSVAAERLQMSRATLTRNLRAASECLLQCSQKVHDFVVRYAGICRGQGIAYFERVAYDSTLATLRVPNPNAANISEQHSSKERGKVFVIEQEWAALFRTRPDDEEAEPGSAFLLVRGCYATSGRVATRGTAEGTCAVLRSAGHTPPQLEDNFKTVVRICETDEESSNVRTEKKFPHLRHQKWKGATLHALCIAHKVHTGAERTWSLSSSTLMSNIIHCLKCLSEVGVMRQVRQRILAEIPARLRILHGGSPPIEAMEFRAHAITLLLPPESAPRRRAHTQATLKILNGNWLHRNVLEHYCSGASCCTSAADTLRKLKTHLAKALTCQKTAMLARNNWQEWSHQVLCVVIFQKICFLWNHR